MYKYDSTVLKDYSKVSEMEVYMPNGLGGYVSVTLGNNLFKKHNSYLTHSYNSPVERYTYVSKVDEQLIFEGKKFNFECQQYKNYTMYGNDYLEAFEYGFIPTYHYKVDDIKVIKKMAPYYNHNACAITYEIINDTNKECYFEIKPLFNNKFLGEAQKLEDLIFTENFSDDSYSLKNDKVNIKFKYSCGEIIQNSDKYVSEIVNLFDIKTGDERLDLAYTPISLKINIKAKETKMVEIIFTTENVKKSAKQIIDEYQERYEKIIKKCDLDDEFAKLLTISGDSFICQRKSTNLKTILAGLPWFTDWGRDTMIAFTGLLLVTKRFKEAQEVLLSFKQYENNGLIPNMFPSNNEDPLYNTVDASLWYFYACYKYIMYTGDYDFIIDNIYPTLKNIIKAYENGTSFNIHMDSDGLIIAGSDLDQITWMDVRVNDVVVTPRHGKPVEINALWYNALLIMDFIGSHINEDTSYFLKLANKVKESFNKRFFNSETNCLYDVLDVDDPSVRPNQLFAVSLPYKILSKEISKKVVDVCTNELYTRYGMRSLSFNDPRFKPKYEGKLWDRDMAYHMGTTWGFLIGSYIDAYAYVNDYSDESLDYLCDVVGKFKKHMNEYCINGIAEIFDGLEPDVSRGCSNQAWSIGELLRAYYENILVRGRKI